MSEDQNIERFHATARGTGWPTRVAISDTDWTFKVDEPEDGGGSNTGPNPMHHFLASLVGCQNEQAQVVAEELGFEAKQIEFTAEINLNLAGFMGVADNSEGCFKQVRLEAVVTGVSADQVATLGSRVDARCPILSLLRSAGTIIESTWVAR